MQDPWRAKDERDASTPNSSIQGTGRCVLLVSITILEAGPQIGRETVGATNSPICTLLQFVRVPHRDKDTLYRISTGA